MGNCALLAISCALALLATTQAQTTYQVQLTGNSNLPAVDTDATATLVITFNADSNNVTYDLDFNSVPVPTAAHIHVNAGPSQNGSVGIPLWMGNFAPDASAGPVSGRVASNAVSDAGFVGPLEVLPDYNNVPVGTVLSQYIESGQAYAQVHNLEYPTGFIRGNFPGTSLDAVVEPASAPVQTVSSS